MYVMTIDQLDLSILDDLRQDGRTTVRSIALEQMKRRATIHARISKMEEHGVIQGYTVIPDFPEMGKPITVFILASIEQREFKQIEELEVLHERIATILNITEVYSTSGEYDFLIKARVSDLLEVQKIIYRLRTMAIRKTYTISIFETHLEELSNEPFNLS